MSSRLMDLTPHAEIVSKAQARTVNVTAAVGLQNVLKTNLGPRGTLKMLVGGAGQIKLTKDGQVLLKEMQIQHPTASLIARTATAQDDITGDGTTSTVLLCGELLKQAHRVASEGLHPRIIADGFDLARDATLEFLKTFKVPLEAQSNDNDDGNNNKIRNKWNRTIMQQMAQTSLRTKLEHGLADRMTEAVVDSVQCIGEIQNTSTPQQEEEGGESKEGEEPSMPLDLNRVEIMTMPQRSKTDATFVNGLVLDHGGRHPDMPRVLHNCHIMTCNVSLEYEKTEVQAGFFYSNADEREKLVESERTWLDEKCKQIVHLKRSVCKQENESFVIINQKGVDPLSLDMFAKEGILCLRRAKRRNMERLTLACGGTPIHSLEDLDESMLGYAGKVHEVTIDEDKFTFVEECKHAKSCTLLLQGPNNHVIGQIKDAVRDGLRSLKNAIDDGALIPGAGAFEVAAAMHLKDVVAKSAKGRSKLGIESFAEALMVIPKTLAENSGLDVQESMLLLQDEVRATEGTMAVGLDVQTGQPILPQEEGIWDNVRVKRQSLHLATILANQLLLVDEVIRAGKQMGHAPPAQGGGDLE